MSELSADTAQFIREHRGEDVRRLALQAHRYPTVDMPTALRQIEGWQTARGKLPTWAACEGIRYPSRLALEQCSSEATARYKCRVVGGEDREGTGGRLSLTDLTGGFGVDCALLAPLFAEVTYVERQEELCEAAKHNFAALGLNRITVCHADCTEYLERMEPVDWMFIDPARRDSHGGRVTAIADCQPDVSALEPLLLQKARRVLVKLSPMLDLTQAMHELKHVCEVHVVAVGNECKELLMVLGSDSPKEGAYITRTIVSLPLGEVGGAGGIECFSFTCQQERECPCTYVSELKQYLYEPNAALLKAGAFRILSYIYNVEKLHPNSHLYTSDRLLADFPGRKFKVVGSCGFGRRELKALMGDERRANLTVRNFPATVAELRKRLRLAEGGDAYLFATTLADGRKLLIRCRAV